MLMSLLNIGYLNQNAQSNKAESNSHNDSAGDVKEALNFAAKLEALKDEKNEKDDGTQDINMYAASLISAPYVCCDQLNADASTDTLTQTDGVPDGQAADVSGEVPNSSAMHQAGEELAEVAGNANADGTADDVADSVPAQGIKAYQDVPKGSEYQTGFTKEASDGQAADVGGEVPNSSATHQAGEELAEVAGNANADGTADDVADSVPAQGIKAYQDVPKGSEYQTGFTKEASDGQAADVGGEVPNSSATHQAGEELAEVAGNANADGTADDVADSVPAQGIKAYQSVSIDQKEAPADNDIIGNQDANALTTPVNNNFSSVENANFDLKLKEQVTNNSVVNQVIEHLDKLGAKIKNAESGLDLTFHLQPDNLGKIAIEMSLIDGKLNARIIADTQFAYQLINNNLLQLQQAVQSTGLDVKDFTLMLGQQEAQDMFGNGWSSGQGRYNANYYAQDSYIEAKQSYMRDLDAILSDCSFNQYA